MIKLVYCIRRRADLSFEAFSHTWLVDHAPLVKRYADAIRAVRYVQSHSLQSPLDADFQASRGLEPPHDGITEVWWESEAAMHEGLASEAGQAAARALLEDEKRFIDFARSTIFLSREHAIF